jgi:tetratricopeptide (TPR) repeat protein
MLGRFDAARDDALASRIGVASDWRAYFTAAKAAYSLGDYRASRDFVDRALEQNPNGPGLQREHERCMARLREEEHGQYDFSALLASLSPENVHMDVANFLGNTVVRSSPHHGNGLFAARDLKVGDIVFVEKAAVMPNQYIPDRASAALYANMVLQLYNNPSLASSVLALYGGDIERTRAEGQVIDGVPVVNIYLVENIRQMNCFSCPVSTFEETKPASRTGDRQAKGLWRHGSYLNHSCVPNTMRAFVGDVFISRACREIRAGDELFQQYVPVRADWDARQERYSGWGFECACMLCAAEKASPRERREKRLALLYQIEKLGHKKPAAGGGLVSEAAIRTVNRLAQQLDELHEAEVYGDTLPRLALVFPHLWLLRAHRGRKNHAKVVAYALRVLRDFGFPAKTSADGAPVGIMEALRRPGDASLMTIHVVSALKFAGEAYQAMGQQRQADEFLQAARFGYLLMTGFENDLSAIDED